jgi:hypothetical protein
MQKLTCEKLMEAALEADSSRCQQQLPSKAGDSDGDQEGRV